MTILGMQDTKKTTKDSENLVLSVRRTRKATRTGVKTGPEGQTTTCIGSCDFTSS
ncbi:MAG: hypothetical protein U0174_16645 [Polyangiaceae bacterium]